MASRPHIHIAGAGLAGLSAAVGLAQSGHAVTVYDAAPQAGGRCRSYHDGALGMTIDNGNHLLLSGNRAARRYIAMIGAEGAFISPAEAAFPFIDLASGQRWTLRPNKGPLPWWMLAPARRVAGTGAADYLSALKLLAAKKDQVFTDCVAPGNALYTRFWEPLALAALNTPLDQASAALLRPVLTETFLRGATHCRPMIARDSLAAALIDPALALLERLGGRIHFAHRLARIELADGQATALHFTSRRIGLAPGDTLVLALPSWSLNGLLPDIRVPEGAHAIVNAHFACALPALPPVPLLGLVNGTAHWLFFRDGLISATVSAADGLAAQPAEAIAALIWADAAKALGLDHGVIPPYRIVKEKRATFAQTPAAALTRPGTITRWHNILLAGDWTATGLPATIEGALRSGFAAARALGAPLAAD